MYQKGNTLFSSVTPVYHESFVSSSRNLKHYDFTTFLAVAQSLEVDFLNTTWHEGLGTAGRGATAGVQQALVDKSFNLAFKRFVDISDPERLFATLLSEILVLQQPVIRDHKNIIDLYGVSWDIQLDKETGKSQIFPVLVFENASLFGSLDRFLERVPSVLHDVTESKHEFALKTLSVHERMRLCRDIGLAIQTLHVCNVIHGDLKPSNILVFPDNHGGFIPKLIDFGFSTYGFSDTDLVRLPCSEEWRAPEWHPRAFEIKEAKKTDIYSYAKICQWILAPQGDYYFYQSNLNFKISLEYFFTKGLQTDPQKRTGNIATLVSFLEKLLSSEMISWAGVDSCYANSAELCPPDTSGILEEPPAFLGSYEYHDILGFYESPPATTGFFESVINLSDFIDEHISAQFQNPLSENNELPDDERCVPNPPVLVCQNLPEVPDLARLFNTIQGFHYLVRQHISNDLLHRVGYKGECVLWSRSVTEEAFQLALCYELAIGVSRNLATIQYWLHLSLRTESDLAAAVDVAINSDWGYKGKVEALNGLNSGGHHAQYLSTGLASQALKSYRVESEGKVLRIGLCKVATLTLRMRLVSLLSVQGQGDEALALVRQDLKACKRNWGERDTWTLLMTHLLASTLAEQGNVAEAISINRWVLQIREENDGQDDESTLSVMQDLASDLADTCDYQESVDIQKKVWESYRTRVGEYHPDTLNSLERLAYTLTHSDMEEAERLQQRVLEIEKRVLGDDDHALIITMENLAYVQAQIKDKRLSAVRLQSEVLARKKRSLVSSYAEIIAATDRLAWIQERADQIEGAIDTRAQILEESKWHLDCPEVLAAIGNHAKLLAETGQTSEAESLKALLLAKIPTYLQPRQHISNNIIRGVANGFLRANRFDDDAVAIYKQAFDLWRARKETLGELHPTTKVVQELLAVLHDHGHLLQASLKILGLEHLTTKMALLMVQNRLRNFAEDDEEVFNLVTQILNLTWKRTTKE